MRKLKILTVVILITIFASLLSGCMVRMPLPSVKEGRFNFSVTYEIDGDVKTYSGVYVCEFDGVCVTFLGKGLEWKGRIENEEDIDVPIQTNEEGVVHINFGFFPEYFMGDPSAEYYDVPKPNLYMIYHSDDPNVLSIEGDEQIIEGYGVKILEYDYADPIENTFNEKLSFGRFVPSIN